VKTIPTHGQHARHATRDRPENEPDLSTGHGSHHGANDGTRQDHGQLEDVEQLPLLVVADS
jgi:hypothetical protein